MKRTSLLLLPLLTLLCGNILCGNIFAQGNIAPTLNALNDAKSQLWTADFTVVDSNATVTDPDSANFAGGALIVQVVGGLATDRLSIKSGSAATGAINVVNRDVRLGNTSIGTLTSNLPVAGAAFLRINLKAAATPAITTTLLRSISYRNQSATEVLGTRILRFKVLDGDGGTSAAVNKAIRLGTLNGNYSGTFIGSLQFGTNPPVSIPGPLTIPAGSNVFNATVTDGNIQVSIPAASGTGNGTVAPNGAVDFTTSGTIGSISIQIRFQGIFRLTAANVATGSGTWSVVATAPNQVVTGSGTWTANRP